MYLNISNLIKIRYFKSKYSKMRDLIKISYKKIKIMLALKVNKLDLVFLVIAFG